MSIKIRCKRLWEDLLDFLLPRLCCGCGERIIDKAWLVCEPCLLSIPPLFQPLCVTCGCPDARVKTENKCRNCPPGKVWFIGSRGSAPFDGMARTMIFKLKYQKRTEYASLLAEIMAECYSDWKDANGEIIVPVPLHSTRQRQRGFNQAALLAEHFGRRSHLPIAGKALLRIKPIPSQTRLKKSERRKNVAGAFACRNPEQIRGKRLILVDDVYTTGSTFNECSRVLMEAGAHSVQCLAYARAVLD